jgi:hypothetical protein
MSNSTLPVLPPEILIDNENTRLIDQVRAALSHPLSQSFQDCLDTLVRLATNVNGKTRLFLDFAPLSFEFVVLKADGSRWINGGVIFHGQHDGYGSGSAPTFAVSIGGADGWQIHT